VSEMMIDVIQKTPSYFVKESKVNEIDDLPSI
jgi:hypothetical protein